MAILNDSMHVAEAARNWGNEDRAEINSKNDAGVREQSARPCHYDARHGRVQNVLHFWIWRHEALQEKEHSMQLAGVSSEEAQQMPEKQCARSEREKKQ